MDLLSLCCWDHLSYRHCLLGTECASWWSLWDASLRGPSPCLRGGSPSGLPTGVLGVLLPSPCAPFPGVLPVWEHAPPFSQSCRVINVGLEVGPLPGCWHPVMGHWTCPEHRPEPQASGPGQPLPSQALAVPLPSGAETFSPPGASIATSPSQPVTALKTLSSNFSGLCNCLISSAKS